jgi:hypothetical protein
VPELGDESGVGQHPHGALLLDVDHDRLARAPVDDEPDDAVLTRIGVLHHATVATDLHVVSIARGYDSNTLT